MVLATTHKRTTVTSDSATDVLELDVARHLWGPSRPDVGSTVDPEERFKLTLAANDSGILELHGDAYPSKVVYRVLDSGYSVLLSPVALVNNVGVSTRSIKVNLPDRIRSNCLTLVQFTTEEGDQAIIIDCLTETDVLITAIVKLSDFISSTPFASSANHKEWSSVSQPYGFDIRKPHMLYAFSADYLLVLLKDGGVVALQRTHGFATEPLVYNDSSYLESLGQFWKPWSKKNNFMVDHELSAKTVIDIIHFKDYIITVTLNRHLRIWSIKTQSLVLEKNLADFAPDGPDSKSYFDESHTKILNIATLEIFGEESTYLTTYLPFGKGSFKISSINTESFDINDLGSRYTFDCSLPTESAIWLLADFKLASHENKLQLWVLWKSNTSSFVQTLEVDGDLNPTWTDVMDSSVEITKRIHETWSEYYIKQLFKSGLFTNQIIEIALPIFEQHFLKDLEKEELLDVSLCERTIKSVSRGITFNPKYDSSLEVQWSRFYMLCLELKRQCEEPLKLYLDEKSNYAVILNRQRFAIVRPISPVEYIDCNKQLKVESFGTDRDAYLKFMNIITEFMNSFSGDVLQKVYNEVVGTFSHPTQATETILSNIYANHLRDQINPVNLNKLVEQLTGFENILLLVEGAVKLQSSDDESNQLTKSRLSALGVDVFAIATWESINVRRNISFAILILLLVLDFDDKNLLNVLSKKIVKLLISFDLFDMVWEIGFNKEGQIEVDEAVLTGNTLFTEVLTRRYSAQFPVSSFQIVPFINNEVIPFILKPEFLYSAVTILISKNLSCLVYERLLRFFDSTVVFNLLKAFVFFKLGQPVKASKYFANHADEISKHQLTPDEAQALSFVEDLKMFFDPKVGKYYLNVAILFLNNLNFDQAQYFLTLLAEKRNGTGFDKKYLEHESYVLFTCAIEKLDFVVANDALPYIKDPKMREEALTKFLYKMCKHQQINRLKEFTSLREDPQVDSLILKRAQTDDVSKSLWFYQVLYAHRLSYGNFRGASEALYSFIVRNKHNDTDSVQLTMAELYCAIINLVSTLATNEQWIIKHENEDHVVTLQELKQERKLLLHGFKKELRLKYDS